MTADTIRMGSERNFGLVFAGVSAIVACYPLLQGGPVRHWALAVAGAFLALALAVPRLLAPLNRLWFRFGLALGAVMTPVAMALLFAVAVIPTALVLKLFGKDPLQRRIDRAAETYWERREVQPGPMREQF